VKLIIPARKTEPGSRTRTGVAMKTSSKPFS
jgi:hypothetical protein